MAGAAPSFSDVHVVRTLLILSKGLVGRKNLVKELSIGEGSVRTIMKKLAIDGLTASQPRGHELSSKGRVVVSNYLRKFEIPKLAALDIAPKKKCSVLVLKNAAGRITTGLAEREVAVRAGADGAIVLKSVSGRLAFPSGEPSLEKYPETKSFLGREGLGRDDVAVISFSDSEAKAVEGALAIALEVHHLRTPI
jgi:hypothetical protein